MNFGPVPIDFLGIGFLFGLVVWACVYSIRALVHSAHVVSELPE